MNQRELKEKILPQVKELAVKAGQKLKQYSKKIHKLKVSSKASEGMVSQADIETEKFIQKGLSKIFREAGFLGEESIYIMGNNKKEAFNKCKRTDWCWIVDPLDGTHNFLNGIDYYAVCIALAYFGEPVLGVVFRPETKELYFAVKGTGAFKENSFIGKKIKLSREKNTKKLTQCMVATGFALEKGDANSVEFRYLKKMMKECRGVRRFGSAALDMCLVSEGKFDCYWEKGLSPWDVAASGIICLEADVKVTDYNNKKFNPFQKSILCAKKPLFNELIKVF